MQAVGMLGTYISQGVYTVAGPFHPFGGAVDIIVVRQQDGSFKTSPWYVKFGKFQGVLKSREKIVDIAVNDVPTDFHMYLDRTGEAYFLKDPDPDEPDTVLSPLSAASSGDEVVDYKKRRPLSPQLMKSVSESAVIKQGFEIPEKYDLAEIAVPETSSDEKVANSTSPAAASSLADGSPPKQLDAAVVERPKTGKRNPKPPRSLLALMFGSKSSGSSGVLSSSETDKAAAETNLEKQNSIGRAEMVADLLESRWSIGERDFLPIDLTEAQHPEEVHDDLPVSKTLHPVGSLKKDEMQESALSIEPCNKLLGEAQSSLAEDLPHSSVERQDEMVLSPRELMVNVDDDGSKKAGDNSNYYHVGLDVTDFMAESSLVQTTDTSNTEMIIMSYDAHLLSAPVLSDNQQYLKKESGQESLMAIHSACTSGNYEVSSIIHQVISHPTNDYKEGCEFTTINEPPELPDGSANLLHVKSIIEPDTFRVSPILRTTDRPHLIDEGCDVVLQHKTLSFGKSVEPAMTTLESPCAFSEDSHTPLQPVASVEVLLGDSDLVHKKQNISEVISQDSRQIVTDKDESAWDLAPFRLSQKEIQEVDFTDSACIPEIHSSGSSYRVPLSISKPSTGFHGFDEGDSSKPHGLYMESFQVVNFTEPEMISDVIGDMKSTGTQFSKTSSSDSLGSDERSIFESPSPVVSALDLSPTSGSCEPVIFDGAGQQHDAAEPAYPDCKPEILQEFVVSVDPLAERCDCRNNDFKVGYNSMGGNDDSCAAEQVWQKGSFASCPATGMASTGGGEVDQVVGDLESALHVKELEHFYSFKDIDTSVVNLEFNNGISWNCQMVKDFCCSTDNENGLNISGACDVRVETNALLGSTDSRISESEYLFVESHGGESREPEVEPLIVRSNPILIPRISNQDIESEVQTYNRCIPGSLPIHLSETVDLKDKYFCSHSVGSLPFSNMDASHNHATNDKYVLSRSDTEGDKPCNTIEELDTGSSKHTMLDTPGNENDTVGGSNTGVEISLCRHLLTEGMGAESAAKAFSAEKVSYDVFRLSGQDIFANDRLVVKIGERYFPWVAAAPLVLGKMAFGMEVPQDAMGAINVETPDSEAIKVGETGNNALVPSSGGWRLWPFPFRRSRNSKKDNLPSLPSKAMVAVAEVALRSTLTEELLEKNTYYSRPRRPKVRSYVPTSEQLASLNLKEGPNKVTFTFFTRVLGKQQVDARIYLWKWNTRIVISDVDGTITKSDVLGQFMPLVGKDWTQSGVTRLFSGIKENGYELLFLSARAIAQAYLTRQFLLNLKQDGETLPDGPVVISPDGLFPSLYREVIRRAPHEFKISCLEAIRELFPMDVNPFYAGFGNRETDEISYLKVGIPKGKIFIINARGEVVVNHRVDMRSYTSLHSLVDDMFPPISPEIAQIKDLLMVQEDFNSWNFWKMPLPEIDIELNETSKNQSTKKVGDSRK